VELGWWCMTLMLGRPPGRVSTCRVKLVCQLLKLLHLQL
jgi:hypothetical protein